MAQQFELQRNDSICNTPEMILLNLIRNGSDLKLRAYISENPDSVNLILGDPYDMPVLFACCYYLTKEVKYTTVITLIELGAHLYHSDYDEKDGKKYFQDENKDAIHYAALGQNPLILKTIVDEIYESSPEKLNALSNGRTALNLLVKEGKPESEGFLECIEVLVRAGVDVNITDKRNLTPIFWAAKRGYKDAVDIILHQSKQAVDIDTHKLEQKSARDYITKIGINLSLFPANNNEVGNSINVLAGYLKEYNENSFINYENIYSYVNSDDGQSTFLQMATERNLEKVVEYLLSKEVDVNKTSPNNKMAPIQIATERGFHKILNLLLKKSDISVPSMVILNALKNIDNEIIDDSINYKLCYELLINCDKILDINVYDNNGRTPLHYAALNGGGEVTLDLLRKGASMACPNRFGTLPIADIDAHILETHLDECLVANVEHSIDKENFIASYNYKTLMPPSLTPQEREQKNYDIESANKLVAQEIKQLTSETQVLSFMGKSKDLRHLLVHPVVTSFLYMKWHRIRCLFYINAAFYFAFCLSLIAYILFIYDYKKDGEEQNFVYYFLTILLCGTFVLLIIRETFQMIAAPKTYFFWNFENWFELVLIGFTAFILFNKNSSEYVKRQVLSVAILLAAFELVILIGQHPKMSTNIVMLRTVSLNFFKFLAWYSILIIAFALSFYTLFRETDGDKVALKDGEEEEQNFFVNPLIALLKTVVMLTGEFDASSIKFEKYPITSHLIFMLFVFMIAIILFNLLNGLAVSDTQIIKSNSELVSYIALIEHIAYLENNFLGNLWPKYIFQTLTRYCCCLPPALTEKFYVPGVLMRRVTLFPHYLNNYQLSVFPNQQGRVYMEEDEYTDSENNNCIKNLHYIYLDKKIAKRTKQMLRERKEKLEAEAKEREFQKTQEKILEQQQTMILHQQNMINDLQKEQQFIINKLDYIITKISV